MPGPTTEVPNKDLNEQKADLSEVRSGVAVLGADVHRIGLGLGELRAEFRFARWLVGILLAVTISSLGGGIWQAATLTANVQALD